MDVRVAGLVAEFTTDVDELEGVARRALADCFGCDAAYVATIGPRFVERSPVYFQRILADPSGISSIILGDDQPRRADHGHVPPGAQGNPVLRLL